MELRHLRSFVAVYETGGFRTAADLEHLAQPAVTRHVQQLEREFGALLFTRDRQGARPTPAGAALYAEIEPTLRSLLRTLDRATMAVGNERTLRIGYIPPAVRGPVAELVATLRSRQPRIVIELEELGSTAIIDGLRSGRLDVGFLAIDDTNGAATGLQITPLMELTYRLVVAAGHPRFARRRIIGLRELDGETLITVAAHEPQHRRILDFIAGHCENLHIQEAFGYAEVHGLVAAGVGLAAVPPLTPGTRHTGVRLLGTRPLLPDAMLSMAVHRRWRSPHATTVEHFAENWTRPHATDGEQIRGVGQG